MAGVPFKLYLPTNDLKVGVVAQSLKHLHAIVKEKLEFAELVTLSLEDGTLICSEDYFEVLEPQTTLVVHTRGRKRSYSGDAEDVSHRKIYRMSNSVQGLPNPGPVIHPGHPQIGWVPCSPPNTPPPNCYHSGSLSYPPSLHHPYQSEFFPSTVSPAEQAAYIQQQLQQQHAYQRQHLQGSQQPASYRPQQQQPAPQQQVQVRLAPQQQVPLSPTQQQQVQVRSPLQRQVQVRLAPQQLNPLSPTQQQQVQVRLAPQQRPTPQQQIQSNPQQVQVRPTPQQQVPVGVALQQVPLQCIRQQERHCVRVQMEVQRERTRTRSISMCSSSSEPISPSSLPPTTALELRSFEGQSSSLSSSVSSTPTHLPTLLPKPPKLLGPFSSGGGVQVTVLPPMPHAQNTPPLQEPARVPSPPSTVGTHVESVQPANILRKMVLATKLASNSCVTTPPHAPCAFLPRVSGAETLTSVTNVAPRMVEKAAIPQAAASSLQTLTPTCTIPATHPNCNSQLPISIASASSHPNTSFSLEHCSFSSGSSRSSGQVAAHPHTVSSISCSRPIPSTSCSRPIPYTSQSPSTTCPWVILSADTCKSDSDVAESSDDSSTASKGKPSPLEQNELEVQENSSDGEGEGELQIDEEFVDEPELKSQPSLTKPPSPPPLPPLPLLPDKTSSCHGSANPTSLTLEKRFFRSSESPPCSADEGYLSATPMSSDKLKQLPFSKFLSEEGGSDEGGADTDVQHCSATESAVETLVLQSKDRCNSIDEEMVHFTLEEAVESNVFADECFKLELQETIVGGQENQACEGDVGDSEIDEGKGQVVGMDFGAQDNKAEEVQAEKSKVNVKDEESKEFVALPGVKDFVAQDVKAKISEEFVAQVVKAEERKENFAIKVEGSEEFVAQGVSVEGGDLLKHKNLLDVTAKERKENVNVEGGDLLKRKNLLDVAAEERKENCAIKAEKSEESVAQDVNVEGGDLKRKNLLDVAAEERKENCVIKAEESEEFVVQDVKVKGGDLLKRKNSLDVTGGKKLLPLKDEESICDHLVFPIDRDSIKNEELDEHIITSAAEFECEPSEPPDAVDQLVVTYSIVCLDGQIVVPTSSDDIVSVSSDFMDLDSDYEEEDIKPFGVIDLTLLSSEDEESEDDEYEIEASITTGTTNSNAMEKKYDREELCDANVVDEKEEKLADLPVMDDVAVAEYGCEVLVLTQGKTTIDVGERFMGELVNLLCNQPSFKGMDKQSVSRLLAKVERHSDELGEYIPLENPSMPMPPRGKVHRYRLPHGKELRPAIHRLSRLFKH